LSPKSLAIGRTSLTTRFRARLKKLLEGNRGTAAMIADYLATSPVSNQSLSQPQISMLKAGTRKHFNLDLIEDLSHALNIPIPQLLGLPKWGDLSAKEHRMLLAFRVIDASLQDHILALLEQASVAPRIISQHSRLLARPSSDIKEPLPHELNEPKEAAYGGSGPSVSDRRDLDLGHVRRLVEALYAALHTQTDARDRPAEPGTAGQ
jgi:hypothetical protein